MLCVSIAVADPPSVSIYKRMFEATFESKKIYKDPFNDVEVDVVFTGAGQSWRVPAFWRGGNQWGVRFAPPTPGEYVYHLESSDKNNTDLNGQERRVTIAAYEGTNALLKHGPLRVSANKRYLEHSDETPFYWLGETLYTALSDRISWEGFQKLISDRKAKGFTLVSVAAGLTVSNEELAPLDPGFRNEGGAVWNADFKQINPRYFDYADRRIQYLIDSEMTPAIIGAWEQALGQMGIAKMKRHWRYLIARYGAYPVIWILGGEITDPSDDVVRKRKITGGHSGWTEVARYVRATDPYGRLLTAHEGPPPYDIPLEDGSLTDFELMQPSHFGWSSVALEVAQLNMRWARTSITKPLVVGEIGWEGIGGIHLQDFQRMAFWLAMLNGAAGFSYGSTETSEAYSADKPFHRVKYSFLTWEEGMDFPGAYQTSQGAKLLKQYPWWRFEPHPEWISPRGTTLLDPRNDTTNVNMGDWTSFFAGVPLPKEGEWPAGEWQAKGGNVFLPYAAGIPGEVRVVYIPYSYYGLLNVMSVTPPTVMGLEPAVKYDAYYWEPSLGIKIDLGAVQVPHAGALICKGRFNAGGKCAWADTATSTRNADGKLSASGQSVILLKKVVVADAVAAVDAHSDTDAGLVLRYQDAGNYLAAIYSSKERAVYLMERLKGVDGPPLGRTPITSIGTDIRIKVEVRNDVAAAAVSDGQRNYATPIVTVRRAASGTVGLMHLEDGSTQSFDHFELHTSPVLVKDGPLERKLYDARGTYRGEMAGPAFPNQPDSSGWDDFGKHKNILLNAYRPDRLPIAGDWVLVLRSAPDSHLTH